MKRALPIFAVVALGALPLLADPGNGNAYGHSDVLKETKHDRSPNLRDIQPLPPEGGPAREKAEPKPLKKNDGLPPEASDAALQTSVGKAAAATTNSFEGVGLGNYSVNAAPPDTNGSIGAPFVVNGVTKQYYVQWVNEAFAVFDAATGAIVYGPANGNTIFNGFGGPCETRNDGDPIVLFDKIHKRWVMTQFALPSGNYTQCVAVSVGEDPTGAYNRYSFSYGTLMNDYPKFGVWPDGYYTTYNMFSNGQTFAGGYVCAFDSAKMIAGVAATQQCFNLGTSHGGMLVGDFDGTALPPAGEPNYVVEFGTNALNLWKFHVDWTTPGNTTLTAIPSLAVASFSQACGGGTCVPQAGTTQQLDSLGDRMMYRFAYRNFGTYASLVANHSVKAGTTRRAANTGVRWYELRTSNGNVSLYQQSTYAPDTNYRWMGSAAMDKVGNIVLGYSKSSSTMNPAIFFTMRAATDPVNTMQAEASIFNGTGSQLRSLARWGDYASLSVDPKDDCTMWFTTEYLATSGTFNWHTRIGKLKAANCL